MSERSNEHDWKSCDVKASAGSNPVLCARWSDSIFTHRNFKRNCNSEFIIGRSIFPTSRRNATLCQIAYKWHNHRRYNSGPHKHSCTVGRGVTEQKVYIRVNSV